MRVVVAGAVVVRQCEVGRVDTCRVGGQVRHAMRAAGAMARAGVEFALQGTHEGAEKIEEQAIRTEYDIAQLMLQQGAENDGAQARLDGGPVDTLDRLVRLVNARHKWQSHGPKFEPLELCHEAVTQCFRGYARLIRDEKCGSTAHGSRVLRKAR